MAADERGLANTYERKIEICQRAYNLLTNEVGIHPTDIIFDPVVLPVGTGIAGHDNYGTDFVEAVRWIKTNLSGCRTIGGISNVSFAFRGNVFVREIVNSTFLHFSIQAGLDMAIMSPTLTEYKLLVPELAKLAENLILNKDDNAVNELIGLVTPNNAPSVKLKDNVPVSVQLQHAVLHGDDYNLDSILKSLLEQTQPMFILNEMLVPALNK